MGIEHPVDSSGKATISAKGGAESGARAAAADLHSLAAAISGHLTPSERTRLAVILLEEQGERKER